MKKVLVVFAFSLVVMILLAPTIAYADTEANVDVTVTVSAYMKLWVTDEGNEPLDHLYWGGEWPDPITRDNVMIDGRTTSQTIEVHVSANVDWTCYIKGTSTHFKFDPEGENSNSKPVGDIMWEDTVPGFQPLLYDEDAEVTSSPENWFEHEEWTDDYIISMTFYVLLDIGDKAGTHVYETMTISLANE